MTVLLIFGLAAALTCGGLLYQWRGSARDARQFPAPGRMIDAGGHRLHVYEAGAGEATVIFEAGIAATSVSWELVWKETAKFARVFLYDRAGLGWSEPSPEPRTIINVVRDLRTLLKNAGVSGPCVLVGHSFGGLAAFEYACAQPREAARLAVVGLVLVDPLTAAEWNTPGVGDAAKLRRGVQLARRGALLARLGVVRLSLDLLQAGSRAIPKLAARISSGNGSQLTERLAGEVRKLPPELWPVIQAHWCQPKSFFSMADHLEHLPESARACAEACDLGDIPVVVLSAADSSDARKQEHVRMAARSRRGEQKTAEKSGHWIQLDQPDLVVEAIRRVVGLARG